VKGQRYAKKDKSQAEPKRLLLRQNTRVNYPLIIRWDAYHLYVVVVVLFWKNWLYYCTE
jgi:hypothetical protein